MFWGAPLVARELETGTFRLAWTQSVSRLRWLLVKLGLVGLASAARRRAVEPDGDVVVQPHRQGEPRTGSAPAAFGVHGFVPAGYALFAFALGATTGLLFRRTLPAMAVTLVGFVAARFVVADWVRPHFMSPVTERSSIEPERGLGLHRVPGAVHSVSAKPPDLPNALIVSNSIVNNAGQSPTASFMQRRARLPGINATACRRPGVRRRTSPSNRRWAAGVPAVYRRHFGQVPPGRRLPAGQPVLGLPDLRDAAVRRRVGRAWPACACGGCATASTEPDADRGRPRDAAQCWCAGHQ